MARATIPCPRCGEPLSLKTESRRLQPMGGRHVVLIDLTDEAKQHIREHEDEGGNG